MHQDAIHISTIIYDKNMTKIIRKEIKKFTKKKLRNYPDSHLIHIHYD